MNISHFHKYYIQTPPHSTIMLPTTSTVRTHGSNGHLASKKAFLVSILISIAVICVFLISDKLETSPSAAASSTSSHTSHTSRQLKKTDIIEKTYNPTPTMYHPTHKPTQEPIEEKKKNKSNKKSSKSYTAPGSRSPAPTGVHTDAPTREPDVHTDAPTREPDVITVSCLFFSFFP